MIPLSRSLKGNRKPFFIAGGIVILLLVVGGYLWWSTSSWSSYHAAYGSWKNETNTKINAALSLPSDTATERAKKLEMLESVSDGISSQALLCMPTGAAAWQQRINSEYDRWRKDCQKMLASVKSVNDTLKKVVDYTRSEHQLAGILAPVLKITDKKMTESGFSSAHEKWKAAVAAVKGMKVSEEFSPVQAKAKVAVNGVEAAWRALVAAHKAKDESGYAKAIQQLSAAYTALESIKKQSGTQTSQLGDTLQKNYDAAF